MRYSKIFYSLLFSTVVKCGTTNTPTSCPSSIIEQGYSCCSDSNCEVVYTDESGDWAIENGEWCGCGGNDITSNTTTTTVSTTITPIHSTSTNCFNSTGHTGESVEISSNRYGDINGVNYELWADSGSNNAIFYGDGSFSCSFQNSVDYICRSGLSFDGTKTHDQIGHLFADFSFVEINAEKVDFSYVGVYGWTKYPVVEFSIVDNWLNQSRPEDWSYYKNHGDFVIDDATYTIYERDDFKFSQFFSVRKEARNCGRIDISAHLTLWGKLGMKLGKIDEVKVFAEAGSYESRTSGEVDFPYAKVFIDNSVDIPDFSDIIIPTPTPTTTITTTITPIQSTRTNCFNSSGHSGESVEITNNSEGDINGINYEVWADGGSHNSIFYSDGSFSFSFQKTREYLCYCGLNFDGTKTYKETGQLYADFEFVSKNVTDVDYSFVGVYGLSKKNDFEIFEYHIIDSWLCPYRPGDWVGNKKYGDFVIDGATYTVYSYDQNRGDPGIGGLYYYHQFFSVRKEPRNCGRIDITAHLEQWEKLGMESYAIKEFKIFVEAGSNGSSGCSGEVDFPYAKIFIDNTTTTTTPSSTCTTTKTPTSQNCFNSSGHFGENVKVNGNEVGEINGVDYESWGETGENNATFYSNGSFTCSFQNSIDYLCRSGLSLDTTKTHDQIGHLYADFEFIEQNIENVDTSYIGIYGWSKLTDGNILVEYYIIDSWISESRPGDWEDYQNRGDFFIDGAMYTVYENNRNSGPGTFKQYISVRKEARSCGRIDITAHFNYWEKLNMTVGKIAEVKILAEAMSNGSGGSGTVDFPYANVFIDNSGDEPNRQGIY